MAHEKLKHDWENDESLKHFDCESVEELAGFLAKTHRSLMDGRGGVISYLYRQQTLRVRRLKQELENERRKPKR